MALKPRIKSISLEVIIGSLLGVAALATAWAAYQSSLAGGNQTQKYNQAIALEDISGQALQQGNQAVAEDHQIFLEFVKATQLNQDDLAAYIQVSLMSDRLKKAVAWWSKQNTDKYNTPFVDANPDYVVQDYIDSNDVHEQAVSLFNEGNDDGKKGDRYTFVTVILAAALFLLGVAAVTKARVVELGFLVLGTAFLLGSAVQLARIRWG